MKFVDLPSAIAAFNEAAQTHGDATATGDHRIANKNYAIMVKIVKWLKKENEISQLRQLLISPNVSVRTWSALYLLPHAEQEALQVLHQIAQGEGIMASNAELTIQEWHKGNLRDL